MSPHDFGMFVWLLRLRLPCNVCCIPCVGHKVDALWANEVDQKNADTVSADDLDDDTVYCVNNDLQSDIDELTGLLESDSDTKFWGF